MPAICDGKSQILDLGRTARFYTKAQRAVMAHRDKQLHRPRLHGPRRLVPRPPQDPWSQGGRTTVKDGTLLCPRHHTLVHHPDYHVAYQPDGKTRITRTKRRRP